LVATVSLTLAVSYATCSWLVSRVEAQGIPELFGSLNSKEFHKFVHNKGITITLGNTDACVSRKHTLMISLMLDKLSTLWCSYMMVSKDTDHMRQHHAPVPLVV